MNPRDLRLLSEVCWRVHVEVEAVVVRELERRIEEAVWALPADTRRRVAGERMWWGLLMWLDEF